MTLQEDFIAQSRKQKIESLDKLVILAEMITKNVSVIRDKIDMIEGNALVAAILLSGSFTASIFLNVHHFVAVSVGLVGVVSLCYLLRRLNDRSAFKRELTAEKISCLNTFRYCRFFGHQRQRSLDNGRGHCPYAFGTRQKLNIYLSLNHHLTAGMSSETYTLDTRSRLS